MDDHLIGHPVSRATWERHGCRCDGCYSDILEHRHRDKAAARARQRKRRLKPHIEIELACGRTVAEIMSKFDVDYSLVKGVLDGLN